ncbi:MAG: HipA family kinase [Chlorobium sp.]
METQGSVPSVFECSDGETYYIKHIGNNRQHVINELIGYSLLQFLDLPTPEIALVDVVPDTVIDEEFDRKPPQGLAFGSKQLKGQSKSLDKGDLFQHQEMCKFAAPQALVGIVLFDIWVYNIDRAPRNPNVLVEEVGKDSFRLVAIDHAVIFEDKEYSSMGRSMNNLPPTIEESLINHALYRNLHDSLGLFFSEEADRVLGRIEEVTESELHDILKVIPDEWEVKDIEKESIIKHYLLPRKNLVRGFYQQLLEDAKITLP